MVVEPFALLDAYGADSVYLYGLTTGMLSLHTCMLSLQVEPFALLDAYGADSVRYALTTGMLYSYSMPVCPHYSYALTDSVRYALTTGMLYSYSIPVVRAYSYGCMAVVRWL